MTASDPEGLLSFILSNLKDLAGNSIADISSVTDGTSIDFDNTVPVISPVFKDYKNGKLKIISFFAKKARGMMVRHLVDIDAKTIEDIKAFNSDGYSYSADETAYPLKPVFTR